MEIQLIVKRPKYKSLTIRINNELTIKDLKRKIAERYNEKYNGFSIIQGINTIDCSKDNRKIKDYFFLKDERIEIRDDNTLLGGMFCPLFVNLSDEYVIKRDVNKDDDPDIPDWRIVCKGINLYGVCKKDGCKANGKQVIMMVHDKKIDLINEGFMGICPICKRHFDLETCGFYKCDYICEGTYFDQKKEKWIDLPEESKSTCDGKISYYDPDKIIKDKESMVKYNKLILKVINYHNEEQ